jgi:putative transposase
MINNQKFNDKYRIPSARLEGYDYGQNGAYFVTISTKDKIHYFGDIVETQYLASSSDRIVLPSHHLKENNVGDLINKTQGIASLLGTIIGEIARQYWLDIPKFFPFVELDEFVVMPNHIHGIIIINRAELNNKTQGIASLPRGENKFAPQSNNLALIIRGFKSGVKSYATKNSIEFFWQPRFYDRIIRDADEMDRIRKYIYNNPFKWNIDRNNPVNI